MPPITAPNTTPYLVGTWEGREKKYAVRTQRGGSRNLDLRCFSLHLFPVIGNVRILARLPSLLVSLVFTINCFCFFGGWGWGLSHVAQVGTCYVAKYGLGLRINLLPPLEY